MAHYLKIFGEDFAAPPASARVKAKPEAPPPPAPITAADVDAAYARGVHDGQSTALAAAARQTEEMVQALLLEIGTVADAARDAADANARLITTLLLKLFRDFFPTLCAEYGPAETTAITAIVLAGLVNEPEVEIRACPAGIAHLEHSFAAAPYEGRSKLTLAPVETMPPGDVTMRWKEGRADRNLAQVWSDILATLNLHGVTDPEPIRPTTPTLIGHTHG